MEIKENLAEIWIVGAGTMGSLVAKQMVAELGDPSVSGKIVIAETQSDYRHDELLESGALPKLRSERSEDDVRGARASERGDPELRRSSAWRSAEGATKGQSDADLRRAGSAAADGLVGLRGGTPPPRR